MKIKGNRVALIQREISDEEKVNLKVSISDMDNMSERHRYPPNTPTEMNFVIEVEDKIIGELKLNNIRWFNRKAELSLLIAPEYQKKGYGTDVIKTLINYTFNSMNLHRLEAEVIEFNEASIKLIEKLGFIKEGTLREAKYSNGSYYDIYRYGLLIKEYKR